MLSVLFVYADVIGEGLEIAAVLISSIAICSGIGITAGVLEKKSNEVITRWGFIGTAVGCVLGLPLMICAFAILERS